MGVKLLGKIKIYEIAKKLNLASKDVIEMAKKLNIDVKSHLSAITEEEAGKLETNLTKKEVKQEKGKENRKKMETKKEEKAPVIIRREVIISKEDEQIKKKENTPKQAKKNNVGFVERKQNKDYNIVYRNKPNKPMTVSELFGLESKKEEKKQKVETVKEENTKKEEKVEKVIINEKVEKNKKVEKIEKSENMEKIEQQPKEQVKPTFKQSTGTRRQENREFNRDRNNNFRNRDNRDNNRYNRNGRNDYRQNNNGNNNRFNNNNKRPLDAKGIEKNIKNIMTVENIEKEPVREYNRDIDKQKANNRFEENKINKKNRQFWKLYNQK